jgi:SAM-dependent methyltransferase
MVRNFPRPSIPWYRRHVLGARWLNRPKGPTFIALALIEGLVRRCSTTSIPERELLYEGPKSAALYWLNGREHIYILKRLHLINGSSHVLDVGCGLGRKAHCIIPTLSSGGSYVGVDVNSTAIAWCESNLASPVSSFAWLDVRNSYYAPTNSRDASSAALPRRSGGFDLVMVCSVFTHMQGTETAAYLEEIARTLAPGGSVFVSLFLLGGDGWYLGRSATYDFDHSGDMCMYADKTCVEHIVAYRWDVFQKLCANAGLVVTSALTGSWRGSKSDATYQDIVILQRSGDVTL